ncbi:MAG: ATP synthase F1 subunit delta [Thermodesulfovibrionales bacterium]|nr:ATP synthase F1 subunit delta [Thermodesulfovibrionales bacterium]
MKKVKGIKKYAKQLLGKIDISEVPTALTQLQTVSSMMEKDRGFRNMLVSPVFSGEEVDKVITLLGDKLKMSDKLTGYLKYIRECGAIIALSEIVRAASILYLDMKNRLKAVVASAVEVSVENKKRLEETLKAVTGKETEVEYITDPTLIGGIRVQLGSKMYDSSIQGQLWLLRDKLIKG